MSQKECQVLLQGIDTDTNLNYCTKSLESLLGELSSHSIAKRHYLSLNTSPSLPCVSSKTIKYFKSFYSLGYREHLNLMTQ